jgi:hypothetical protein
MGTTHYLQNKTIGESHILFISDKLAGELLDTQVRIADEHICCIAGSTIDSFYEELCALIEKYRI